MVLGELVGLWIPEEVTPVRLEPGNTPVRGETRVRFSGEMSYVAAGAMSTETFMVDFLASVKITPLTGGTSP
jgi:hypothetical protein